MKQRVVKTADFTVLNTETSVVYDGRPFNSGTNVPPYHMAVRKKNSGKCGNSTEVWF